MAIYSFDQVYATITGLGLSVNFGYGAGVAEEGISIEYIEDKDTMTIGADGKGMHSKHAGQAGSITVRLLKTSPTNALFMAAYNLQKTPGVVGWGENVISIRDVLRGDGTIANRCAFKKVPNLTYAKDGGMNEWGFNAVAIEVVLGQG